MACMRPMAGRSRSPNMSDADSIKGESRATLLGIPPELRNMIYELVLEAEKPILINRAFEPSSLLLVCRQIRNETNAMYYSAHLNTFRIKVYKQNAKNLVKFTKYINTLDDTMEVALRVDTYGVASITRLLEWCEAIWMDEGTDALEPEEDLNPLRNSIVRVTQMAQEYRGKSWEDFTKALRSLRKTDPELMVTFPVGKARSQ
ncbi:hypothetical protein HII31_00922 [Pseudocercospora fuligena]|uniref:F-box domain-containing protein n=1 Tax=Pseudocercospora fuligena TaxID=685502 RepID=A0A8H6VMI3_9PEZI|nr:hypothetical protein HII31_00922 [Pseudocercospora fuligena]